ncbi:MAG: hypothetical protein IJ688_03095 [Treponema sp.]|nr:hypothetical protein [Treponema sp.]
MKFFDLSIYLAVLLFFMMITAGFVRQFSAMDKIERNLTLQKDSLTFISQSFLNTCEGCGFSSLEEWQKNCRALWNLDYIAWSDAAEFLPVSAERLLYGRWNNGYVSGEIYSFVGEAGGVGESDEKNK